MELLLSGELNINGVAGLREKLLQSVHHEELTLIRIEEIREIDASLLQLLCSAHRSAVGAGKRLNLTVKDSTQFHRQLRDAGFIRHVGCAFGDQSCLWVCSD